MPAAVHRSKPTTWLWSAWCRRAPDHDLDLCIRTAARLGACSNAEQVTKLFAQRGGAFGQGLLWEWDLLNLKEGTR
jgi:hypothetical protein